MSRDELKEQAKKYAYELFHQSETNRLESFEHLVDVIFLYIDQEIKMHCVDKHEDSDEPY